MLLILASLLCFITRIKASFPRSTFFLLLPYIFCCKLLCKLWSCCLLVLLVQVMKSHEAVLCSRLAWFAQFAKVRFRKEFFVLQLPLDRARRRPTQNWSVMRTHWDGFQKSVIGKSRKRCVTANKTAANESWLVFSSLPYGTFSGLLSISPPCWFSPNKQIAQYFDILKFSLIKQYSSALACVTDETKSRYSPDYTEV